MALLGTAMALVGTLIGVWSTLNELFGTEIIELSNATFNVYDRVFAFKRRRTFDVTLMENLLVGASSYWQGSAFLMSESRIQFDYRNRMVSIGGNVNEDEGFRIVERIRKQMTPEEIQR